jgi:hypothetical protein
MKGNWIWPDFLRAFTSSKSVRDKNKASAAWPRWIDNQLLISMQVSLKGWDCLEFDLSLFLIAPTQDCSFADDQGSRSLIYWTFVEQG